VLDTPVLLPIERPNSGEEGELLIVVCSDEIGSTSSVIRFEIGGRFPWPSFDKDDELTIGELEDELVVASKVVTDFQAPFFEGGSDIR
jgi:hypothetical protein